MHPDRSVNEFPTPLSLRWGLAEPNTAEGGRDWELMNYDKRTTVPDVNCLDTECDRLAVLKAYEILDTDEETEFEETTRQAREILDVEIAVVSLVDLGRQWFKSINGLEAKQSPRSCAFCAHVIQRREIDGVMVVPDATKDERFNDNPFVVGGPKIRFYAGVPLVSPEGPRLGTFCIIDSKPRPDGLTDKEKQQLHQLASETVYNIIMR